ncbi:MAG TPA: hypothetical protein PLU53_02160 [Bacteroidia bacterium]|nr:hypothetical protein [Bacteroidia bacterium]
MKNQIAFVLTVFFAFNLSLLSTAQSESDSTEDKISRLPVLSIGQGVLNFIGDIGYSRLNQPFTARSGFQLEIQQHTKSRFSIAAFILSGRIFGEEKSLLRTLNFRSSMVAEGLLLRFDFSSSHNPRQVLIPYLTAGIEYVFFHAKADMKDANGTTYHYWNDGSIRDIDENDTGAYRAVKIHRDYTYETDLRDANADGFGKYRQGSWAFPVGAGARFKISSRCSMHFSSVLHLINSDLVEAVTSESAGTRQGNNRDDRVLYSSVSFRYDLSAPRDVQKKNKVKIRKEDVEHIDFNQLANEDADHDGIPDVRDDSSATPQNNKVRDNGKPLDTDEDGIPDYRDKEPNSAKDAVVNTDGMTITEEMIEQKFREDSLAALPALIEYIQSYDRLTQRNPNIEKRDAARPNGLPADISIIPSLYRRLDRDLNGIISPKEISIAIDEYIEGRSQYTVPEFYNLIDFFFSQR